MLDFFALVISLFSKPELQIPPDSKPVEIQIELPSPIIATATPVEMPIPEEIKCLCVAYARFVGMRIPYPTNADELVPNGTPDIGNGILFRYGNVSHLAVILGYTDEGYKVTEANKTPCEVSERVVPWNDPNIVGFVKG